MANFKESLDNVNQNLGKIANVLPEEMSGFMKLHNAALEDGSLNHKTKELIALGISIAIRCEPCIVSHVHDLIKLGFTRKEIEETVAVAIFMGGGPSLAYGGKVLEAFDQLS